MGNELRLVVTLLFEIAEKFALLVPFNLRSFVLWLRQFELMGDRLESVKTFVKKSMGKRGKCTKQTLDAYRFLYAITIDKPSAEDSVQHAHMARGKSLIWCQIHVNKPTVNVGVI